MDTSWIEQFKHRLREPLPGWAAQRKFEPTLGYGRHRSPPLDGARQAAVMVLFYPDVGRWNLPLVVRPQTMASHAGQIGLPGGALEAGESEHEAALRELEEELGVPPRLVQPIGELSPIYVYASNFHVTPFVGFCNSRPQFVPDAREVAELVELPLAELCNPANFGTCVRHKQACQFTVPCIHYGDHEIWGATAMLLGELVQLLEEIGVTPGAMPQC